MAWWANYRPGGVEAALEQREQGRQEAQRAAISAHFREQAARREAERQLERQEAEAQRVRLREQQRGGKLAWAARLVLSIGVPRAKPLNPPLDCLADMPLPERSKDLGRTAAFLLEQVAAGKLSTADAESVLSLAKRSVDLQQAARPISLDDFRL